VQAENALFHVDPHHHWLRVMMRQSISALTVQIESLLAAAAGTAAGPTTAAAGRTRPLICGCRRRTGLAAG
jgi:hypothetical protein